MTEHQRLSALIEEARAKDGTYVGMSSQQFDFAQWLHGVRDGANPKDGPAQMMLL